MDKASNVRSTAPMSTPRRRTGRVTRGWASVRSIGIGYVVAAIVFSVAGVLLTTDPANGGGAAAAILSVAISVPVAFAGRAPARAAVAQAAGYLLSEILFGPMIRCGYVLPAMLVIVFALGAAGSGTQRSSRWLGLGACVATSAMMALWDPALDSSATIFIGGLFGGVLMAGVLIRSRTNLVQALQRRTDELERQRNRTAALEVAADRARVGADLERLIRAQITAIGANAELARTSAGDDPAGARAALADVETSGRATLAQMREVVGDLREVTTEPSPGLEQLAGLLRRATTAEARLSVHGADRQLPRSIELSAYRIVEQLLKTMRDHPDAQVEVQIQVTDEALDILVRGLPITDNVFDTGSLDAAGFDQDTAMNAARARAELHGGLLTARLESTGKALGRREIEVRLPLVTASSG